MEKFKHYKEAETRAAEIKTELDAVNAEITKDEAEARSEATDVERRGAVIEELKGKVVKRDALQAEYDGVIEARDALKAEQEEQIGLIPNIGENRIETRAQTRIEYERSSEQDIIATRSYELAWANAVRTGNDAECRNLISTAKGTGTANGGVLVPKTLINRIEDVLKTGGRILNLCSVSSIKGITEYPVAKSYTDPALHDETGTASKTEKDIVLDAVTMEPQFIAEILTTTRKFEADSIEAFFDWLMEELPDALRRVIDSKILTGGQSAKDGIHGILTNTNAQFVAALAGHTINFNTANAAVAELDDGIEDNVTIVMNRKTFFNTVMNLVGADGHPIWKQVADNITNKPTFTFGGYPVVFTSALPDYQAAATGAAYMVAGDFRAFRLNFPLGLNPRLVRDDITQKKDNKVEYLSEIYVAGNIVRPKAFVKVTK